MDQMDDTDIPTGNAHDDESGEDLDTDGEEYQPETKRQKTSANSRGRPRAPALKSQGDAKPKQSRARKTVKSKETAAAESKTVVKADSYNYARIIAENSKPFFTIEQMFADLVKKGLSMNLPEAINNLENRPLQVGTACSGTECPIIALELIVECLQNDTNFCDKFKFDHVMSAEIEPFKQAYIRKNFPGVKALFRDVTEWLSEDVDTFTTAYGSKAEAPYNLDLFITGSCCVDFSTLNNTPKTVEERGESGQTFFGIVAYCKKYRPAMVILENVAPAPWKDEIVQKKFEEKIRNQEKMVGGDKGKIPAEKAKKCEDHGLDWYFSQIEYDSESIIVDTKKYYIPQTRERGYMVCIDKERFKKESERKELLREWKKILKLLESPASVSTDDMLFAAKDDVEVELSPAATVLEEISMEKQNVIPWDKAKKDYYEYRQQRGYGHKRTLTFWGDKGSKRLPDFWALAMNREKERPLEVTEIAHLRNIARGFDDRYYSRFLDLSQNVHREEDMTKPGILSCLTPKGFSFSTTAGRRLTGREELIMQGIPVTMLDLSHLSEANQHDLVGNAMTSTVIGAVILATLMAFHPGLKKNNEDPEIESGAQPLDDDIDDTENLVFNESNLGHSAALSVEEAMLHAKSTVALCSCEKSQTMVDRRFKRCKTCKHTKCSYCGNNPIHNYERIPRSELNDRKQPFYFETILRKALPSKIEFNSGGTDFTAFLEGINHQKCDHIETSTWEPIIDTFKAGLQPLLFRSIKRTFVWEVLFESEQAKLILSISPHEVEWLLYAKPPLDMPIGDEHRKQVEEFPIARMRPSGDIKEGCWSLWLPQVRKIEAIITFNGRLVPSFEAYCGLHAFKDTFVWNQLWINTCDKESKDFGTDVDISGQYDLAQECGHAWNSLHVKTTTKGSVSPTFLKFDHQLQTGDPRDHYFVITKNAKRLGTREYRSSVARFLPEFRQPLIEHVVMDDGSSMYKSRTASRKRSSDNSGFFESDGKLFDLSEITTKEKVDIIVDGTWFDTPELSFAISDSPVRYKQLKENLHLWSDLSCGKSKTVFQCEATVPDTLASSYPRAKWMTINQRIATRFYNDFRWLIYRGLRIEEGLTSNPLKEHWEQYKRCINCTPVLPTLKWGLSQPKNTNRREVFEDHESCARYERSLKAQGAAISCMFHILGNSMVFKVKLNPQILMHKAADQLLSDHHAGPILTSWSLITNDHFSPRQRTKPFTLMDNKKGEEYQQPAYPSSTAYSLRPEQSRSLQWQIQRENNPGSFAQESFVEAVERGVGLHILAKAKRDTTARGGVLAHHVGFGKTAIILALLHAQMSIDEDWGNKITDGYINLKATLILVTPTLCKQWVTETKKFLGKDKFVIVIEKNINALRSCTVGTLRKADIIIMSWAVLKGEAYTKDLAAVGGMIVADKSSARSQDEWYKEARQCVKEAVNEMKADAPGFVSWIDAKRKSYEAELSKLPPVPVPSKRLRGDGRKKNTQSLGDATFPVPEEDDVQDDAKPQGPSVRPASVGVKGAKVGSLNDMKKTVLEMYSFARIVVDEFPDADPNSARFIEHSQCRSRWLLSGTPPLNSFADVKSIARLFGINLGRDDYINMPKDVFRKAIKEMSHSEKFLLYEPAPTQAWIEERQKCAQRFLDCFARKDMAEIGDIKKSELVRIISQPLAAKVSYIELMQLLAENDFHTTRMSEWRGADRDDVKDAVSDFKYGEEALLYRAATFKNRSNEIADGTREEQYHKRKAEIEEILQKADCLVSVTGSEADMSYQNFIRRINDGGFGDPQVTNELRTLLREYKMQNAIVWNPNWGPSLSDDPLEATKMARQLIGELTTKIEQLVRDRRSIRFSITAHNMSVTTSTDAKNIHSCQKCSKQNVSPADVLILSNCGHVVCAEPSCQPGETNVCRVEGCSSSSLPYQIIPGNSWGCVDNNQDATSVTGFGKKFDEVLLLLKDITKAKERCLIFVQQDKHRKDIEHMLKSNGITFLVLDSTPHLSDNLEKFKEQTSELYSVLILKLGDPSSAGCNLTIANHVIFFSPYFTSGSSAQQKYNSDMAQAVGRTVRYGQTKAVKIYHFLCANTIDIDLMEARRSEIVDRKSGEDTSTFGFRARKKIGADEEKHNSEGDDDFETERYGPLSSAVAHLLYDDEIE